MNFKKLAAYVQLCRPVNVLITLVSIPVACWIAGGTASSWVFILLAGTTGALVAAGANALNDAFDIDIDRINRPDRPLPQGILTPQDARRMWFILSLAATGINLFLNLASMLLVILSIALLYVYSARLKRTVLIGNILVGFMTGMTFIYGGIVVGGLERAFIPAVFAFLVNLARELLKDVEDMEGDRRENAVTLPLRYGVRTALVGATVSIFVLIGVTIAVALSPLYHPAFLYIVLVADSFMCGSIGLIWLDHSSAKNIRRASTILKGSMMIGLLSIVAGSM
jgi:geranylgeranylglycerol-phosphate geranylgeranyltransferase